MSTVAGIFNSRTDAERAIEQLRSIGMADNNLSLLAPGTTEQEMEAAVETTETEQPGMGGAVGGVVGGAMGVASGATIGAAAASLLVPGVGPVLAAGLIGAALFGAGGAAAGAATGDALEDAVAPGLPHDELYVYEDALRKGRTVVIAVADDEEGAEAARNVLAQSGAESIDAAREDWWIGLRDAEEEEYTGQGKDFKSDEPLYRRGFESALHADMRGKQYEETAQFLRERYGEDCASDAFKCGYDRGQSYQKDLQERYKG
jgi:hypothetical protein